MSGSWLLVIMLTMSPTELKVQYHEFNNQYFCIYVASKARKFRSTARTITNVYAQCFLVKELGGQNGRF